MKIDSVYLENFRGYSSLDIVGLAPLNIITGRNASGKTNLLESLYMCAVGKSVRAAKDKELIKWGEKHTYVSLNVNKKFGKHRIEIFIDEQGKKRVAIDRLPIAKIGELLGVLGIVYFSPDELRLIKDAPGERRRFMDISLSQQSKAYYYTLQRYNNVLAQRNKLLKLGYNAQDIARTLPIWDGELAKEGAEIISERIKFIDNLKIIAAEKHAYLTDDGERLSMKYEQCIENADRATTQKLLLEALYNSREKDTRLGFTSVGPHRDDIYFDIDGIDVRKYGSQGQQRTTALSLKLAETAIYNKQTGEMPVLLLDDVLSELDEKRMNCLIESTCAIEQTFITCTEYNLKDSLAKNIYAINNGIINKIQ